MATIPGWKQANSNISRIQTGRSGDDAEVIGALEGRPTLVPYRDVRTSSALGSGSQVAFFDHFFGNVGASALPAPWVEDAADLGAALPLGATGSQSGLLGLTTDTSSGDNITIALGTHWKISDGWLFFETNVALGQTATTVFEVGLSDALNENGGLAFSDHTVAGVTDVAANAVVFAYDSAAGANWLVNTSNAGTPQAVNTGVAASTSRITLRIEVNATGDAWFYVNNNLVATVDGAIATTALVGPWLSLVTLTTAAKTANVDYVSVVGDNGF